MGHTSTLGHQAAASSDIYGLNMLLSLCLASLLLVVDLIHHIIRFSSFHTIKLWFLKKEVTKKNVRKCMYGKFLKKKSKQPFTVGLFNVNTTFHP